MTEESGKYITDKHGKKRFVADSSLENLKLGSQSRNQGKVRRNFTLLPKTISWLEHGGNASGRIDEMVGKILSGALVNSNSPSPALAEALNKISQLEQQLKRSQERIAELEEIAAVAQETVDSMVKKNMTSGNALPKLRDILREKLREHDG